MSGMTTTFLAESMRTHGYRVVGGAETPILGGAADSRLVQTADLFAAFRGEHQDGNDFVDEALQRGAAAAVCEREPAQGWPDRTLAVVDDTRVALAALARDWRRACGTKVIGITGTVGKTTAKDLTATALAQRHGTHRSPGNLNSREGLPLALMSLTRHHAVSVLEMAMDSEGEIAELSAIAEPFVGVVLNIGATHLSKLGSMAAITREKLALVRGLPADGVAVINMDDERIAPVAGELHCNVIGFGANASARLRHGEIRDFGLEGTEFPVTFEDEEQTVRLRLLGSHLVPTALAAIGAELALGESLAGAAEAVSTAEIEGRLSVRRSVSGALILDDSYNASPDSVAGALALLAGLSGRRVALLGEMAELGERAESEHGRIGRLAAERCDALLATGRLCQVLVREAQRAGLREARWFETKEAAAERAAELLSCGDHILVKASRSQALETVIPTLEGAA